jgi:ADP-ribosyl-[dinitrogen reductase] hydrolase
VDRAQGVSSISLGNRVTGCFLGGACGDALGWPVEFLKLSQIIQRHGPEGISHFGQTRQGQVTDDTQMTLFTVEGLIRAHVRGSLKGICHPPGVVHHAYLRWLETQEPGSYRMALDQEPDGWLITERRLWAQRAPGNTCLAALRSNRTFGAASENDSKGCGTVMRSAPFGFLAQRREDMTSMFEIAVESAQTTHGHPSGYYAAGALAWIISLIVQGSPLQDAVQQAIRMLHEHDGSQEVRTRLEQALQVAKEPSWRELLPRLGQGWVAEEALAIAVMCALAAETPRDAILAAVNHDGDSDSTGSIAGNILGAIHGPAAFPQDWLGNVEMRDVIEALAEDFTAVLEDRIDPEKLWDRYPGW